MKLSPWIARSGLVLAAMLIVAWMAIGLVLESFVNRVEPVAMPTVTPAAEALHRTSFVADLHADSLLFGRDLLERSSMGHVDLPRLQEGGVALQVFSLPTIVPFGLNVEYNEAGGLDFPDPSRASLSSRRPLASGRRVAPCIAPTGFETSLGPRPANSSSWRHAPISNTSNRPAPKAPK